ncbi:hypothetical protein LJC12_05735, partial [Odoribacter sp. OttesenSCG-928-J03]|nr:hypothetical protein [Odoribacter sp. OttesenSCG-928-J03]
SKSADLQLSSFSNKNIQLNTADVLANIDLIANTGKFVNNTDANMADFPANRFKCSFKSFTWYMEEAFLNIGIEDPNELARIWKIEDDSQIPEQGKNIFIATAREADSLSFIAPLAKYSLTTGDISCMWVNHIDIANGRFYPNNGDVFISNVGDIREFTHSVLLCERSIRNRKLNEVDLKLRGRYTFNGSGDFDYINQEKQRTVIRFTKIGVDTARNLYSSVNMAQEAEFKLNAGITYKGEITLLSKLPDLFFNGSVRLTADDKYLKQSWLKVKTFFKASDIRVPVDIENRDDKGNRLFNGIFLNVDRTIRPYATYTSSRLFYDDNMILGGKGELVWLGDEKRYTIKDLSTNPYYYFDYIPDQNTVSGFGQLATNMDIPGITQHMVGNISYNLEKEDLKIDNALYRLELILLSKMQGAIVKDFTHKRLKRIEPDSSLMEKLSIIYNPLFMAALHKQMNKNSNNVPDSLECLLTLDSLAMGWDKKNRSYVYNGEVYVRSVMKKPVDEMYNVMLEFIPRRSGNQLFIYLYKDDLWYYFEYVNKSLFTLSSNGEYNGIVRNEKADKKIIQNKLKETLYTITLCPDSKKNRFVKRMATVEGDVAQE